MKYLIAVTGGSGAGKSTVSNILREYGIEIIDGDIVARTIMEPGEKCLAETVQAFGRKILDNDGRLVRSKLADIVFSDKNKLSALNAITHKYITEYFLISAKTSNSDIVGIDGAAIFESGINKKCDFVIGVIADEKVRISRIINRDGISEEKAKARIAAQKKDEFYIENCDYIVYNNGNKEQLIKQIGEVLEKLEYEKEKKQKENK